MLRMGILRTAVQEHGGFVHVQLLFRLRTDGQEKVRGQQPDATVPGVLRPRQEHHENGLQVPEPSGGRECHVRQWHGLPLRVQHALLVRRQTEESEGRAAA